jgi:subtilisin family serine protease
MIPILLFALAFSKSGDAVVRELAASGHAQVIVALRRQATPRGSARVTARWRNLSGFAAEVTPESLAELEADPNVLRVDLDSGGTGGLAQSVPLIGGDKTRAIGATGRGVYVAVLDSGVDETHPDLAGRIADEQCFCRDLNGDGCCPNKQQTQSGAGAAADDNGHGTNVVGIIASRGIVTASPGVAPDVNLVIVKILDRDNTFRSSSQVLSGLDWLITNHPEVRVVNMSLYTSALFDGYCDSAASFTALFAQAVRTLRARGTLVFACSGNEASAKLIGAPACVEAAVSVGAVYDGNVGLFSFGSCHDNTTAADQITCFSDSNATLDLLGPGAWITSDGRGGGTSTYAGTSQATPHAAGAAAVLIALKPSATPDEIESLLKRTGKPIVDARNGVTTPRIDLFAAVQELLRTLPPTPPRRRAARH